MSVDLAIDLQSRDLVPTPNGDFALSSGPGALMQRVHNVLLCPKDGWILDRSIGSHVYDVLRSPMPRAAGEIELAVREALEAMGEVSVLDVKVEPVGPAAVKATIQYTPIDQVDDGNLSVSTTVVNFGSPA